MCHFKFEKSFNNHRVKCENFNKCTAILPKDKDKILKFKNHRYKESVPFVVYADIESLLEPVDNEQIDMAAYQKHVPTSVAFYTHCNFDDSLSELKIYRTKDCIDWFMKELKSLADKVDTLLKNIVPMEALTLKQKKEFIAAKTCHICEKPFEAADIKHRDHCHITGKYQGCNLNYKDSHVIPVVFHNLSGYDSHFSIKAVATSFEGQIKLLPVNKEKYIFFTNDVGNTNVKLRFIDFCRFMPSSLEKLASYLNNNDKNITRMFCQNDSEFNI